MASSSNNSIFLLCMVLLLTTSSLFSMSSAQGSQPPCLTKLLPCKPFLHATTRPPVTCCLPLTQLLSDDPLCLCDILTNQNILNSFNVTKEEALNLPKICGATADLSKCNNTGGSQVAPSPVSGTANPPLTPPLNETKSTSDAYSKKSFAGIMVPVVLVIGWIQWLL